MPQQSNIPDAYITFKMAHRSKRGLSHIDQEARFQQLHEELKVDVSTADQLLRDTDIVADFALKAAWLILQDPSDRGRVLKMINGIKNAVLGQLVHAAVLEVLRFVAED